MGLSGAEMDSWSNNCSQSTLSSAFLLYFNHLPLHSISLAGWTHAILLTDPLIQQSGRGREREGEKRSVSLSRAASD